MAKKKTSKNSVKKDESYSAELWGVILILVGIMGFGSFGPVGEVIRGFAIFLMGTWYVFALFACIVSGAYMMIKRKKPNYWTIKLIGFYMIMLALLVYSHMEYAIQENLNGKEIIEATINNFMDSGIDYTVNSGGGIIGGIFTIAFTKLFDYDGTKIVLVVLSALGIILTFNINLGDLVGKIKKLFGKMKIENDSDEEVTDDGRFKSKLFGKKERSIEDTVCTESLENVKVYSNMGELLEQNNHNKQEEQLSMELNNQERIEFTNESAKTNKNYTLPTLDILDKIKPQGKVNSTEFLQSNKAALERVLNDFQINGRVVEIHEGPAVTQFEVEIKAGTKVSRITSINKEIALALAARDVRIQAPIPGKSTVGIEIPNSKIASVPIREVLSRPTKESVNAKIPVALGKDLMGQIKWADISKMPHLLVAGSTGSGKSVCINSFIATILMTKRPDEVKLVLVDPKKVELSNYNGIPHLLWPVVTDPKKASAALQKVVAMMEEQI